MTKAKRQPTIGSIKATLAKLEAKAKAKMQREIPDRVEDVGTPLTIVRLRQPPLAQLIEQKAIGPDERIAADEILLAFSTIARQMRIKPLSMQRVQGSRQEPDLETLVHDGQYAQAMPWPIKLTSLVARYQRFASYWSNRAKLGDPTLAILISAVVDETPIRGVNGIAFNEGIGHRRVQRAIVAGLRDYAARAGMVTGGQAIRWQKAATEVFPVEHPELAISRVRAAQSAAPTT